MSKNCSRRLLVLIKEFIQKAKSVEDAINLACEKLCVSREEITFEVIKLPKKGFLGIKNTLAEVKVLINKGQTNNEMVVQNKEKATIQTKKKIANDLLEYLKKILSNFELNDLQFKLDFTESNQINISIKNSESMPIFSLNNNEFSIALQHIGNVYLSKACYKVNLPKLILDFNNLKDKQKEKLTKLIDNISKILLKTKNKVTLEPMNSYERMIVHTIVTKIPNLTSKSTGKDKERRVVLYYQNTP